MYRSDLILPVFKTPGDDPRAGLLNQIIVFAGGFRFIKSMSCRVKSASTCRYLTGLSKMRCGVPRAIC